MAQMNRISHFAIAVAYDHVVLTLPSRVDS